MSINKNTKSHDQLKIHDVGFDNRMHIYGN